MIFAKMNARKILILILVVGINPATLPLMAQQIQKPVRKALRTPVIFVDSVSIDYQEVAGIKKDDIALIDVYKDSSAVRLLGPDGRDGVIFLMTKDFARKIYRDFFSAQSPEYARLVASTGADSAVQYILNGQPLFVDYEGQLAKVPQSGLKEIRIVDQAVLERDYQIQHKKMGVVITCEKLAQPTTTH